MIDIENLEDDIYLDGSIHRYHYRSCCPLFPTKREKLKKVIIEKIIKFLNRSVFLLDVLYNYSKVVKNKVIHIKKM